MRSKKVLKNIVVSLLLQLITIICGFILPRLIITSYGSSVNGLVNSITQFLAYITLLESGVGPVVKATLYKPIAEKDNKKIASILKASEKFFRIIAYIFIAYLLILCVAFPIIMNDQFEPMFTISLVVIIAISTFSEYYFGMTYKLYLQAEQKTYIVSSIQIFTIILNTILSVILIKLGFSIQVVKLVSAFIYVLRPVLQNLYVKKRYEINFKEADNNYKLEKKWDGLAQHIASVIHNNADVTILTFFSTMEEVSVYSVYYLIISGIKRVVEAITGGADASFGDMIARKEKENLNKKFTMYETFYFTLITVIYICTFILIVPFVRLYTSGVDDADYIRPVFAFLIVLAEFMHSIRLPYSSLTLSAGHFKETKKGAWVEAGVNILLSIILVIKFGIIGVAIGTFVAMLIRTIEFMYHTSKQVLDRSMFKSVKRIIVIIFEVAIVFLINKIFLSGFEVLSYIDWIIYAIIIAVISVAIVTIINFVMNRKDFFDMFKMLKNMKKSNA